MMRTLVLSARKAVPSPRGMVAKRRMPLLFDDVACMSVNLEKRCRGSAYLWKYSKWSVIACASLLDRHVGDAWLSNHGRATGRHHRTKEANASDTHYGLAIDLHARSR